uniref:ATP synthase complex subunit 8 n=1 Tax=Dermestidae sp. GENSP01 TaxID=1205804 RepID=A0A0S2MRW7_9COLE|nr:ATP synthase F0 subunit 8 [Dermestidae sp. GENSP01]
MPQMAPMSWLTLFTMFSIMFLLINSLNYYSTVTSSINQESGKKGKKTNWKW